MTAKGQATLFPGKTGGRFMQVRREQAGLRELWEQRVPSKLAESLLPLGSAAEDKLVAT